MKRSLIILLSVLLFITVNIQSASAVVAPVINVAAKPVIRALAEKSAMQLTTRQVDNVVSVINRRALDGDQKSIDFINKANNVIDMPSSEPASKTGFKKYVLDPVMWLSGLDLIFDIADLFKNAVDTGATVETTIINEVCVPSIAITNWDNSTKKATFTIKDGVGNVKTVVAPAGYSNWNGVFLKSSNPAIYNASYARWEIQTTVGVNLSTGVIGESGWNLGVTLPFDGDNYNLGGSNCGKIPGTYTPDLADVVDISNVSPTTKTTFDNDTYNTNTVYNIEIELPDNPDMNDTTVWNEPDINIENEIVIPPPVVVDPDIDPENDDVIGAVLVKGDPIETPSNFFTLMGDMGAKLHDTYNGVVKFFSDSVSGMEKLMVGSAGLVAFMTGFFDIFPTEFTTVLTVGFMMGFIMYFFRR